jgi:hypothetical protein
VACKFENMVQEANEGYIEWFKIKVELSNEGLDIKMELNESHVSMKECECLWGPKISKNGFKFTSCNDPSVVVRIHKLWPIVY